MRERVRELWAAFVDGRLTDVELDELAAAISESPEVVDEFLADLEMVGLLGQLGVSEEEFVRSFRERLRAEDDVSGLLRAVGRRISEEARRKGARVSTRKRPAAVRRRWHFLPYVAAAAAAAVVLGLLFLLPGVGGVGGDRTDGLAVSPEDRPAAQETSEARQPENEPGKPEGLSVDERIEIVAAPEPESVEIDEIPTGFSGERVARTEDTNDPETAGEPELAAEPDTHATMDTTRNPASVGFVRGKARYRRRDGAKSFQVIDGIRFGPGDSLDTLLGAVRIDFEGAAVFCGKGVRLSFVPSGLRVEDGEIVCDVSGGADRLGVLTADGVVRHIGTRFSVKVLPGETVVTVAEGEVELETTAGKARLSEGLQAEMSRGREPGRPRKVDAVHEMAWVRGLFPRVTTGLEVFLPLGEGAGHVAHGITRAGTPINLTVPEEGAAWIEGGLAARKVTTVASETPASALTRACKRTNEITIEAWVRSASTAQSGPARIISLSVDRYNRNFTLAQGVFQGPSSVYVARLTTTDTNRNGLPELVTPVGSLNTRLTHVVYTREADGTERIYLNGAERASGKRGGDLSNWDENYRLLLFNELTEDRPWLGEIYLAAIYSRALSRAEVLQNRDAGLLAKAATTNGGR